MNKKFFSKIILTSLISALTLTYAGNSIKPHAMDKSFSVNENVIPSTYVADILFNLSDGTYNKLNENEFQIKSEGYDAIINSKTGNITHNFYNESGVLTKSYTTNYYENLRNIPEEFALYSDNVLSTNSIPYKLNSQHYTIAEYSDGQKLYAQNSSNQYKSYYLNTRYTSDTNVMNFVSAVDKTASKARLLINTVGVAAGIAITAFFGIGVSITVTTLTAALRALGYVTLVGGAVSITNLYNDYVDATIEADHRFNAL